MKTFINNVFLICFLFLSKEIFAFGQNKVVYNSDKWSIISTRHFDVYISRDYYKIGITGAKLAEESYDFISRLLKYKLQKRIPIIIYPSHLKFERTNVTAGLIGQGTGGFTEMFKNRVVVPFTGSYPDFFHVIRHELTHAFQFDMLYNNQFEGLFTKQFMNTPPLWFMEGMAEYCSRKGWDEKEGLMFMRDAVLNEKLPSIYDLEIFRIPNGYMIYKMGQSIVTYIADKFGTTILADLLLDFQQTHDFSASMFRLIGLKPKELNDKWQLFVKRKFLPEIKILNNPLMEFREISKEFFLKSPYNLSPVFLHNRRIAYLTIPNLNIAIVSQKTDPDAFRKILKNTGFRTKVLDIKLRQNMPSLSASKDGTLLAFVVTGNRYDRIVVITSYSGTIIKNITLPLEEIDDVSFSPKNRLLVFSALKGDMRDIYTCTLNGKNLTRITRDKYTDISPIFYRSDDEIIFVSNRKHDIFSKNYDIFRMRLSTGKIDILVDSSGADLSPDISIDNRLVYTSDRDTYQSIYVKDLNTGKEKRLSKNFGGDMSPKWSPDGTEIVFTCYNATRFSVYLYEAVDDITNISENSDEREIDTEKDIPNNKYQPKNLHNPFNSFKPYFSLFYQDDNRGPILKDARYKEQDEKKIKELKKFYEDLHKEFEPEEKQDFFSIDKYRLSITPDWVNAGFQYSSYTGFLGFAEIGISDMLGNHNLVFSADYLSAVRNFNFNIAYYLLKYRVNFGFGVMKYKNYLSYNFLNFSYADLVSAASYSDIEYFNQYGFYSIFSFPINRFFRIDSYTAFMHYEENYSSIYEKDKSTNLFESSISISFDNTLYGYTAPISGIRLNAVITKTFDLSGLITGAYKKNPSEYAVQDWDYFTVFIDFRGYLNILRRYVFALRTIFGTVLGRNKNENKFRLGGFDTIRGYDYGEFENTNIGLINLEFRFPFIDFLQIAWPIVLTFQGLSGIIFWDTGISFDNWNDVQGIWKNPLTNRWEYNAIKSTLGFGFRIMIQPIFLFRLDFAVKYYGTWIDWNDGKRIVFSIGYDY